MIYAVNVTVSLKNGMLNPEASTIERSLALLGYEVKDTKTSEEISFVMEDESEADIREKVDDMCQKLLCNPIIHDYEIKITEIDCESCNCN